MNRWQFWVFNALSVALAACFLGNFYLGRTNDMTNNGLVQVNATVEHARQAEPILDQLAKRIARGSEVDPQLKTLLAKHKVNVTLEVDGKKKNYP